MITATSFSGVMSGTTGSFSGQVNVGSNIKLGTAGVVTATSFVGSGANLTNLPAANITGTLPAISGANLTNLPAQATIANNADNRVITGGSGVNLNGESTLLFDGTDTLEMGTAAGGSGYDSNMKLRIGRGGDNQICVRNTGGDTSYGGLIFGDQSSSFGGGIQYHHNGNSLRFYTAGSTERLRIDASGRTILNNAAVGSNEYLTLGPNGSTPCDMAFRLNNDNDARIKFYDGGSTLRGVFGYTTYANNSDYPNFHDSFYLQTDPSSNGTLATASVSYTHLTLPTKRIV